MYSTKEQHNSLYERLYNSGVVINNRDYWKKIKTKSFRNKILNSEKIIVQKWIDDFQINTSRILRIGCFTRDPNNLLMWSHYGKNHKGIVLGFDFGENSYFSQSIYPVKYHRKNCGLDVKYCYGKKPNNKETIDILTWKNKEWKYEKEVRLLIPKDKIDYLQTNKMYGISNCSKYLKEIVIGYRTDDEIIRKIMDNFHNTTTIKRCVLMRKDYRIIISENWEELIKEQANS